MATSNSILGNALDVLREGQNLTIEAVAKRAGLTKPGVIHHFPGKEALTTAVVSRVMDLWEAELNSRVQKGAGDLDRLRAYIDFAFMADFDPSDLALLADTNLRDRLVENWIHRLEPWFGITAGGNDAEQTACRAARLMADGAWFDRSLGLVCLGEAERRATRDLALSLLRNVAQAQSNAIEGRGLAVEDANL